MRKLFRRRAFLAFVSMLLLSATLGAQCITVEAGPIKIVLDLSHGQDGQWPKLADLMAEFECNLTAEGYEVVWARGGINTTVLSGAQFLFLGSVYGDNLADSEITAIKNWFETGEKTIWVAGDSDFGGASYIVVNNTNRVLETIGSKLRAEPTSVEDPQSNCERSYRVAANVTNTEDVEVADIVSNVSKALFHGPTILCGYKEGTYVALETEEMENVYWVMKTSAAGVIVDDDPTYLPYAHVNGQKGSFVIMAVEKFAGPYNNSKIIVTGENPYGGYQPTYTPEYYGVQLDGPALVVNTVRWEVKGLNVFPFVADGINFTVVTVSNSSVSNFTFTKAGKEISFNVTGPEGTVGFCRVTIPKALLKADPYWNWTILLNGANITQYATTLENENYTYIYFTYNHTTQNVQIIGTWVIPEFPSALILPLLLIIALIAVIAAKRTLIPVISPQWIKTKTDIMAKNRPRGNRCPRKFVT